MRTAAEDKLIDLARFITRPTSKKLYSLIAPQFEKLLALSDVNSLYRQVRSDSSGLEFFSSCLGALDTQVLWNPAEAETIPRRGPLIVVANHPFGGIDGIILGALLAGIRSDIKILGNFFLQHIPEIKELIIPVDPFGGPNAARGNMRAMKQALQWLQCGGALIAFPAGEVAHMTLSRWGIADSPWSEHVAWLARRAGAGVTPVFFHGRNSALFQVAGMLHPRLRTALLPREVIRKKSNAVRLHIGSPIPYRSLADFQTDRAMIDYLRLRTSVMSNRAVRPRLLTGAVFRLPGIRGRLRPVAPALPVHLLQHDIDRLQPEQLLCRQGDFSVYAATAEDIPCLLLEIGRLRELAFREIGEGTGRQRDLDRFDEHYIHIFIWSRKDREIAGGYRIGAIDEILSTKGASGLYVTTLFKFQKDFFTGLGPALELGRSFISPRFQKKHNTLAILWRGIGEYVARNPRYKILLGPVSISNSYHRVSKDLMVQFLGAVKADPVLSRHIKPKKPVMSSLPARIESRVLAEIPTVDHMDALVAEIESDRKGIPVLLRHYLKLNGAILSFNIDKKFSNSIDSLLVVDLLQSEKRLLNRFMGTNGLERFISYHEEFPRSAA